MDMDQDIGMYKCTSIHTSTSRRANFTPGWASTKTRHKDQNKQNKARSHSRSTHVLGAPRLPEGRELAQRGEGDSGRKLTTSDE